MNNELVNRQNINNEFKWDIEAMYPDESKWDKDIEESIKLSEEFASFKGHAADTPEHLLSSLQLSEKIWRTIEHPFVYSKMKHDEDNTLSKYQEMNNKAMTVIAQISSMTSFFTPELLTYDKSTIDEFIDSKPELEVFRFELDSAFKEKAHILTSEEENIMAQLSEIFSGPGEIFDMLNDADMDFGEVLDDDGNTVQLTHGNYINLMESDSREIRKNVYDTLYSQYKKFNNTLSSTYNYSVKEDVITARLRKYNSAIESSISSGNIPLSVYDNLITAVHKYLPTLHKYVSIRKRVMKIDDMKMYDIYRPLLKPANLSITFEEAVDTMCKALAPLGEEYVSTLREGINNKWVDIYENKGKTSGAYSFGSYDSYPYILMNFTGQLKDIFTLVHECGHSMNSSYTRKTQPYIYGSHSIFTAEVASTVNETLLINYLLEHSESDEMTLYLINFYIDEFKSTLIRQTMFAEFEKETHEIVEKGGSLTPEILNSLYNKLNSEYFGPEIKDDEYIQYEWSRIPHFYRSFYVYQYATGYSAANAIADLILNGGIEERDNYLSFLKSGNSDYPIELLKIAGVDMSTEQPIISALETFSKLVDKMDKLI